MQLIDFAIDRGNMLISQEGDGEDDRSLWNYLDSRFDHSWIQSRAQSGLGLGCYWIPKGRVRLDLTYLARALEVKRFGYTTRKIRDISPPRNLDRSFVEVVRSREMAQPNRFMGKRRQEEWVDEDDLLGGDLG
jgi:hypothetical protein